MAVFLRRQRHRQRERVGVLIGSPRLAIDERESAAFVMDGADLLAAEEHDELIGHGRLFNVSSSLLMFAGFTWSRSDTLVGDSVLRSIDTARAFRVRRMRPISAPGLPLSTSMSHFLLVPVFVAR